MAKALAVTPSVPDTALPSLCRAESQKNSLLRDYDYARADMLRFGQRRSCQFAR